MRPRRLVAAALMFAVVALAVQAVSAHSQVDAASRALTYLSSQQAADGSIPAGFPSYEPTEDYVIAAAAAGYDPNALDSAAGHSPVDYLAAHVLAASADAGAAGRLIQAVVASGHDPRSFASRDLVATVEATYNSGTGAYGDGQTFSQALAIIGLRAASVAVPVPAVTYLKNAQDSDGGWNYLALKNDAAGSDTNSTAMALMALIAAGDSGVTASAVTWLHGQQDTTGGFPYQSGLGTDATSTALVIEAAVAAEQDPTSSAWTKSGHTPLDALTATQTASGGFAGYGGVSAFNTAQVTLGLLLQTQPARGAYASGSTMLSQHSATVKALEYLNQAESTADGSVGSSTAATAEFVIAAAATGFDPNTLRNNGGPTAVSRLGAIASTATAPGDLGLLIEASLAAGKNPASFGGVNLLNLLYATYEPATGKFGSGETFTQSLALFGLEAAHATVPTSSIDALLSNQNSDGGWNYLATKNDSSGSDTNSTAMALMALNGAGIHSADATALAWIKTQQVPSGGFAYQAKWGPTSDADSDALVLQALMSTHQDPAAPRWASHTTGPTVIQDLLALQTASGGYAGFNGVDAFTTVQVPIALDRVPYPVDFSARSYYAVGRTLPTSLSPTPAPSVTGSLGQPITTAPAPTHRVFAATRALAAVEAGDTHVETPNPDPTQVPAPSPTSDVLAATSPETVPGVEGNGGGEGAKPSWWWIYIMVALAGVGLTVFVSNTVGRRRG